MEPERALELAREAGATYAELRLEQIQEQRLRMEDGGLDTVAEGEESGFALRVLLDGSWGFASGHGEVAKADIERAVRLARGMRAGREVVLASRAAQRTEAIWRPKVDPRDIDIAEKVELLADMHAAAKTVEGIGSITTGYADSVLRKRFLDSDGADITWGLNRIVAQAQFTARGKGDVQGRSARVGGTAGWERFRDEDPRDKVVAAARSTVAALGARSAKGGRTTVVLDPELAGVFAHEAVGHAAEGDLVNAGESCLKDMMGKAIGIEGLTISDDATLPGGFGSYPFDDNGVRTGRRDIVRDGRLVGFLLDREHAGRLGMEPNGAARAQDHRSRPLVRMGNTLIAAGDHTEEEVFAGIKDGVYCKGSRGGQVDTARGTFLFNAQEAYAIRDGEVAEPLRDVSLTGEILATLHRIEALGDTARLGDPGYCGKGQWVPVCDGGPLVRIADCLVGGT